MQEGDAGTKSLYIPPIRPLSEKWSIGTYEREGTFGPEGNFCPISIVTERSGCAVEAHGSREQGSRGYVCQGIGRNADYGKPCTYRSISFGATKPRKQPHRRLEAVDSHIRNDCIKC